MNPGQALRSLGAAAAFIPMTPTHAWSGNVQGQKKGGAQGDARVRYPELASIHQIPFVLGLPAAASVMASFPGTMVDSCLSLCRRSA